MNLKIFKVSKNYQFMELYLFITNQLKIKGYENGNKN